MINTPIPIFSVPKLNIEDFTDIKLLSLELPNSNNLGYECIFIDGHSDQSFIYLIPNEIEKRYQVDGVEKLKWKGVSNTYFFPIQSNTQANILRAKFDLGDMNLEQKKYWTSTRETNQASATGILD